MNDDVISQSDFLKAFGVTDPANQDTQDGGNQDQGNQDPNADQGANPGTGEQTPADNTSGEGSTPKDGDNSANEGGDNQDPQNNDTNNQVSKSAQAFAAMRVELANKNKLLEGVATVLGLDPKQKDSMDQLQTKLNEALAKKQGLPVETLERLNRLEELEQQRNIETVRNNAFQGFQKVKTQFNLSDEELQSFANELVAEGKNPFIKPLDLVTEYKLKNFDRLLEQAKNQGAQDEINRATKANNNASTPDNKQGGAAQTDHPDKITTVKQLNEWFNQQQSGK
jgi:hypothetical protein